MATATRTDSHWRPYDEPPLLSDPMVLGPGHADLADEQALTRYLAQLVAQRSAPVHLSVAFNAAFFGYDLAYRGYVGGPVELDDFPRITVNETIDALPVGAMVAITTGADPLYAEIVYKEGAHPELLDEGPFPAWISGAPANAVASGHIDKTQLQPILTERLVCDFDAFGQDFSATRARLDAWRIRGKHVDIDGHLRVRCRYASTEDAQLDDLASYAAYLLGPGRTRLLSFLVPGPLLSMLTPAAGPDQIAAALHGLQRTVAHALASAPGVRMWRGYAFPADGLTRRMADPGVLGGGDLLDVARELGRPLITRRTKVASAERAVRYTALAQRLPEFRLAGTRLVGTSYPLAVCHANTVIADRLRAHAVDGVLPGGVSVRLDDAWQAGGIWRTEHPAGPRTGVDIFAPSGLGWASTVALSVPEEQLDDRLDDEPLIVLSDSQVSWVVPVRHAHFDGCRCPVPRHVALLITQDGGQPGRTLRLRLDHDGVELVGEEATQDGVGVAQPDDNSTESAQLTPIIWPLELLPAVKVTFTLQLSAAAPFTGSVITAVTKRLAVPVDVGGEIYEHEFDPRVLTRDAAPGCPDRRANRPRTLSLADRIVRAVRTRGQLQDDGTAVLESTQLATSVYGDTPHQPNELFTTLQTLLLAGVVQVRSVEATSEGPRWPPVPGQVGTVEVVAWTPPGGTVVSTLPTPPAPHEPVILAGYLTTSTVRWHLRRLNGKWPGEDAQQKWADMLHSRGQPVRPLPPGYTYISTHGRTRQW